MPKVCYIKPNRTKIRTFKPCDARRICLEVLKDDKELTPEQLLACVAEGMGFTHISLSRQRSVESVSLSKSTAVSLVKVARTGLTLIKSKTKIKSILLAIGAVLEVLDRIDDILDLFEDQPAQDKVEDAKPAGKCNCKKPGNTESLQ